MNSVLHPAGPDAGIIAQFAWVMFGAGTLILLAVIALTFLALRADARPLRPMRWIAGLGIAFPVTVLTILLAWSTYKSGQLRAQTSHQALQIAVTAKLWWWEVRYRDPASGREIISANEIHIPAGRPVYLGLSSQDVIHSLWVPALAGKMDMVPGRVSGLTLQADRPGVYRGQCAEYCGEQHARMALHVVAHTPQQFDAWLAREAQPALVTTDAQAVRGRQAFLAQRCASCHTVRGVGGESRLGPDLTHVGSRLHIAAGTLRNHRGTLAGWIADPHSIKPGARMPAAADIDGETLAALAAWLEQLK